MSPDFKVKGRVKIHVVSRHKNVFYSLSLCTLVQMSQKSNKAKAGCSRKTMKREKELVQEIQLSPVKLMEKTTPNRIVKPTSNESLECKFDIPSPEKPCKTPKPKDLSQLADYSSPCSSFIFSISTMYNLIVFVSAYINFTTSFEKLSQGDPELKNGPISPGFYLFLLFASGYLRLNFIFFSIVSLFKLYNRLLVLYSFAIAQSLLLDLIFLRQSIFCDLIQILVVILVIARTSRRT